MFFVQILATLFLLLSLSVDALAIPEKNYEVTYQETVLAFMKSGERFKFQSHDGRYALSAIRFLNPNAKGTLLILNGQSESWLKYGEVFYDWYHKGYSLYSYDHRGQGTSPHLSNSNPQIGHISKFWDYVEDLHFFIESISKSHQPELKHLFLIAHSMGGAIASAYLEHYPSPFDKVVLNAPMLALNTEPYSPSVARAIVVFNSTLGMAGNRYAPGQGDNSCDLSFEANQVTQSLERWKMNRSICKSNPESVTGGPSNDWVNESLKATDLIQKNASHISVPILMTQAGHEKYVVNSVQNEVCSKIKNCTLLPFPHARHEILMEKDEIRDAAFQAIESHFQSIN